MSSAYEHPTLKMTVTPAQRDRAEAYLQQVYAEDRMTEEEFDWRIGRVLSATNRRELNEAFLGLVQVPATSQALGVHPAYQPMVRPEVKEQAGRGVAGFAHFSAIPLWLFGPGLVYALSTPGTHARREAAKAFNFTLVAWVAIVATAIVAGVTELGLIEAMVPILWVSWLVLSIVGGAKALQGENWRNPVKHVVKLDVLPEK